MMTSLTKPEEGEEQEDLACLNSSVDFVDEIIIPGDILRNLAFWVRARLSGVPKGRCLRVPEGLNRVYRPSRANAYFEDSKTLEQNRPTRFRDDVESLSKEENGRYLKIQNMISFNTN